MCGMSVPMARCTVTGMRCLWAAARTLDAASFAAITPLVRNCPAASPYPMRIRCASFAISFRYFPVSCHAELALAKRGLDVFGSVPGKRYLEIVNERRAIHRDSRDKPAIHQVDQHRPKSHLDDVAAHAPKNRFAFLPRGKNRAEKFAKIARRKNLRKRIQKMAERYISVAGPRELAHADLALSRHQGIRAHCSKYQRLDRVNAHVRTLTVGGKAAGRKPTTASPAGPRSIDSTPSEDRAGIFRDAVNRGFLLRGLAESGGHLHGHLRSFAPCPLPWPLTWRTRARTWPV